MPNPLPISVCLVVKNEADRLERSLSPFVGKVSEILAYDDGSTDGSVEILKRLGATVIEGPWLGFSATRRAVWAMAKEEWILWLDADEVFLAETLNSLKNYFENEENLKNIGGFRICRQVIFEGKKIKHGDWFPDWCLRVFRRYNFIMEDRLVHESVEVKGRVIDLPGIVEHHSFRSWSDLEKRSQTYARLWAEQNLSKKTKIGSPFLHAAWKFFRGYILKSGWLDGELGFKIALHNAREVHLKYSILKQRLANSR